MNKRPLDMWRVLSPHGNVIWEASYPPDADMAEYPAFTLQRAHLVEETVWENA